MIFINLDQMRLHITTFFYLNSLEDLGFNHRTYLDSDLDLISNLIKKLITEGPKNFNKDNLEVYKDLASIKKLLNEINVDNISNILFFKLMSNFNKTNPLYYLYSDILYEIDNKIKLKYFFYDKLNCYEISFIMFEILDEDETRYFVIRP